MIINNYYVLEESIKIVHNLYFFPQEIVKFRKQTTLLINTLFIHLLCPHQP